MPEFRLFIDTDTVKLVRRHKVDFECVYLEPVVYTI